MYLMYNTSLLLMLVFIFDLFAVRWKHNNTYLQKVILGFIIGFIGIIVIKTHFTLESGAIFDTRSILIGISGLFFGIIPTVISMAITSAYRLFEGGVGSFTGIYVIISSGVTGILWRRFLKRDISDISFSNLYIFGVIIHVMMILLMFTFPWKVAENVLSNITIPVLVIYPAGTALLGAIMSNKLQKDKMLSQIKDEETKFRLLADFTTTWDYWTNPSGDFIYCSPACFDITGYTAQEFISDPGLLQKIVHPDDLMKFTGHYESEQKGVSGLDYRIIHKTGKIIWIGHSCTSVLDAEGGFMGKRGTNKDITERIESDVKLIESREEITRLLEVADKSRMALLSLVEDQKIAHNKLAGFNVELERRVAERTSQLEGANRELEAFSYSVSHDLRAPLRAISGFAGILNEKYSHELGGDGIDLCKSIVYNSLKMRMLIDDLLAFSRFSRKEIQKSVIDMKSLFKSIYYELTDEAEREKIIIRIDNLPECRGDTVLMRQVVANLLSNAIKYSSKKEKPEIDITFEELNRSVKYIVKDNGAGFDMAYADKLFGVFKRLHSVNEFEGNGVGLAIVHRIIQRHEGETGGTGAPEKGATFWFTIPV